MIIFVIEILPYVTYLAILADAQKYLEIVFWSFWEVKLYQRAGLQLSYMWLQAFEGSELLFEFLREGEFRGRIFSPCRCTYTTQALPWPSASLCFFTCLYGQHVAQKRKMGWSSAWEPIWLLLLRMLVVIGTSLVPGGRWPKAASHTASEADRREVGYKHHLV